MKLMIRMLLLSDAIFGNGMSAPGGEDICVQADDCGFPYLRGSTLKGIFREELINYLSWEKLPEEEIRNTVERLMGEGGSDEMSEHGKIFFPDLCLHPELRDDIIKEEGISRNEIQGMFTYLRTFTALEGGLAKEGSLRTARCIKKGLSFYGVCRLSEADEELARSVFGLIKWVGTMRNRGFGKVCMEVRSADE